MPADRRIVKVSIAVVAEGEDDDASHSVYEVDGLWAEGDARFGDLFRNADRSLKWLPFAAGDRLVIRTTEQEG